MKNKIIILSGDPNSINSELIYKCISKINRRIKNKIYIISNYNLLKDQFKKLRYKVKLTKVENLNTKQKNNSLKILNVDLNYSNSFKVPKKEASNFVIKSLNLGHKLALNKKVMGIINCAIDKSLLNKKKIGVTEFLASKCGIKDNSEVMLIKNSKLAVSPLTTHVDLKDVVKKINKVSLIKKITTVVNWYKHKLKIKNPKIGILGLNPHNAEFRKNSEEQKIIYPSVLYLKKKGINAVGPLIADTLFMNDYKKYDVIIGMYHDQIITPFKTLFKFDAINLTLGLKYLRVSPDHGTAKNLIKKYKANPLSLIECVNFINKFGR